MEPQSKSQEHGLDTQLPYPSDEELNTWWYSVPSLEDRRRLITALRAEQHDMEMVTREVSKVYDELTGGMLSKPNTAAHHVIERVNDLHEQDIVERTAELQQWVDDLQSEMFVNCVYCGHNYGPRDKVPITMADALKEHVEECEKHPMSIMKKALMAYIMADRAAQVKVAPDLLSLMLEEAERLSRKALPNMFLRPE